MNLGAIECETGKYVYSNIGEKNKKYKCPDCDKRLIFCKGPKKSPYFRHHTDSTIKCWYYDKPNESQIHKDAKLLIKRLIEDNTDLTLNRKCNGCDFYETFTLPAFERTSEIKLEYHYATSSEVNNSDSRKSADVAHVKRSFDKYELLYIIEICHTHKTTTIRPEPWFEIDASSLIYTVNNRTYDAIEESLHNNNLTLKCLRDYKCQLCIQKEEIQRELAKKALEQRELAKKEFERKKLEERELAKKALEQKELERIKNLKEKKKLLSILQANDIKYNEKKISRIAIDDNIVYESKGNETVMDICHNIPDGGTIEIKNSFTGKMIELDPITKKIINDRTWDTINRRPDRISVGIGQLKYWFHSNSELTINDICIICGRYINYDIGEVNINIICSCCDNIYINSEDKDNDKIKRLGGRFDSKYKKWYVNKNNYQKEKILERWSVDNDWEIIKECCRNNWFSSNIKKCAKCNCINVDNMCKTESKESKYFSSKISGTTIYGNGFSSPMECTYNDETLFRDLKWNERTSTCRDLSLSNACKHQFVDKMICCNEWTNATIVFEKCLLCGLLNNTKIQYTRKIWEKQYIV